MGLREFFSSVAGSRSIKEIDPSEKCKWLEQPRPVTSSGKVFTKNNISSPILSDASSTDKTLVSGDDKSSIFSGRRRKFSLAKGKGEKSWRKRKSMSAAQPVVEQDVPEVPVLSLREIERPNVLEVHDIHDGELTRPGTAITTPETQRMPEPLHFEIFELPAESMTPSKKEPDLVVASKARKRSKSSVSEYSRRRMSWFAPTRKQTDDEPPPIPSTEPERPRTAGADHQVVSKSTSLPQITHIEGLRDSIGAEALLRSFPSVPSLNSSSDQNTAKPPLVATTPTSPESLSTSSRLHDSAVVTSPRKFLGANVDIHKPLPSPTSFSQPISPLVVPDSWPRPPSDGQPSKRRSSDTRSAKRRMSNATIAAVPTAGTVTSRSTRTSRRQSESDEGFLSKEQQREYNRVTQFLENMERKSTSGIVKVVTEEMPKLPQRRVSGPETEEELARETFSNEEALKALEFGIAT